MAPSRRRTCVHCALSPSSHCFCAPARLRSMATWRVAPMPAQEPSASDASFAASNADRIASRRGGFHHFCHCLHSRCDRCSYRFILPRQARVHGVLSATGDNREPGSVMCICRQTHPSTSPACTHTPNTNYPIRLTYARTSVSASTSATTGTSCAPDAYSLSESTEARHRTSAQHAAHISDPFPFETFGRRPSSAITTRASATVAVPSWCTRTSSHTTSDAIESPLSARSISQCAPQDHGGPSSTRTCIPAWHITSSCLLMHQ